MGPQALRGFIEQLDAVGTSHPSLSLSTVRTPGKSGGVLRRDGDDVYCCSVTGRFGSTLADPRRTLLERRLEAAETLAGPFILRLEADGVTNVKVLARVPVRAWDLPPCLVEQVERMIGILTARTCATAHYQAHHGSGGNFKSGARRKPASAARASGRLLANNGVGVSGSVDSDANCRRKRRGGGRLRSQQPQHMLTFDPRFQKSAVDPFGRPPRLERVQAGPGQHRGKEDDHNDGSNRVFLEAKDDDLPPGPWDRPPAASDRAGKDDSGDGDHIPEVAVEDEIAPRHPNAAGATGASLSPCKGSSPGSPSSPLPPTPSTTVEPENTQSELLRDLAAAHPEQPKLDIEQRPLGQPRQSHQRGGCLRRKQPLKSSNRKRAPSTNATSKKGGNHPTTPEAFELTTRRQRLTCRFPHCSAVLTSLSTLRTHERSHATAPEYHRLRHAPQLFRDPPPAPSEGDGADAARFRLRTTLPASVRRELQELQEESAHRRRGSLLSLPGLAGVAATWAGVVAPGRKVGESAWVNRCGLQKC
eukprot:jgi/Undpi1/13781/HiC_scaffold_9.g03432.m1